MRDTTVGLGLLLGAAVVAAGIWQLAVTRERYRRARADLAANRAGHKTLTEMVWRRGVSFVATAAVVLAVLAVIAYIGSRK